VSNPVLILQRQEESLAVVTLNRPDRRNALSIEVLESLCRALESLAAEPQRRVVLLHGAGPAFCAGLDLYEASDTDLAEQSAHWIGQTFETLATCPLVTIAAAHGAAYAGGAGLMACCDFTVASDDLQIRFPEVRRGLVPALASVALSRRLRDNDLRELLLLGEPIGARRAWDMGLVDRVVTTGELMPEAHRVAATLLKGAPEAVRQTKRLIRELRADPAPMFAQALELHKQARLSDEAREGLTAFAQRREPQWTTETQ